MKMEIDINKLLGKRFYRCHSLWHFCLMATITSLESNPSYIAHSHKLKMI